MSYSAQMDLLHSAGHALPQWASPGSTPSMWRAGDTQRSNGVPGRHALSCDLVALSGVGKVTLRSYPSLWSSPRHSSRMSRRASWANSLLLPLRTHWLNALIGESHHLSQPDPTSVSQGDGSSAIEPGSMLWLIQRDFLEGKSVEAMVKESLAPVANPQNDRDISQARSSLPTPCLCRRARGPNAMQPQSMSASR